MHHPTEQCYRGEHVAHRDSDKWRYPVIMPLTWRRVHDANVAYYEIPHYTVKWCRYCGYEEKTAHGFEWADLTP